MVHQICVHLISGMNVEHICEYLAGACDRETLASEIDAYWQKQEAR